MIFILCNWQRQNPNLSATCQWRHWLLNKRIEYNMRSLTVQCDYFWDKSVFAAVFISILDESVIGGSI